MTKGFSQEDKDNFKSYMEAANPSTIKFCEECGEECKTGQMLWNGWFAYKGIYHLNCMPQNLKDKYGLK